MKTRKHLLLLAMLAIVSIASAQIKIPNTRLSFDFPNNGWKYLQTTNVDNNTTVYLYSYAGDYVVDNAGDTVLPFMRIYVRQNYDGSVYDLAYSRFITQPFQSLDEYVNEDGSFGYWGAYTNEEDGKDYEFLMLYTKDKNTIFEIRLETTRYNYEQFEDEFKKIMSTVKISK